MDKAKVIITSDGQILQPDEAKSRGNVLAEVHPEAADEAVRYYQERFIELEKYIDAGLRIADKDPESVESKRLRDRLSREISFVRAIGDTESLIKKVKSSNDRIKVNAENEIEELKSAPLEKKEELENDTIEDETQAGTYKESIEVETQAGTDKESTEDVTQSGTDKETTEGETHSEKGNEADEKVLEELRGLVEKAEEISGEADWQFVQHELENIRIKWNDLIADDSSVTESERYISLLKQRESAEKKFEDRKAAHQEKRRERKKENLDQRAKILDQLQNVIDRKKWKAIKEVNSLTNRWEEIRDLPNDPLVEEQNKKFQQLVDEFNEKKVAYIVKKAQVEEENLVGKLAIIDKLKQMVVSIGPETDKWEQLEKNVEELSKQWRKIGHVPLDQSDKVWEQFKAVRDEYFEKKYEFNKAFRKITNKNIQRKTKICENAEALLEDDDLALAISEINLLHKRWKKIGPIPKEKNDELWERFNSATKKLNEVKSDNLDVIREQEKENLEKKSALCEKAESLKESTNWEETSREMDALMSSWKEIGPVPRRKAGKIWRRFKNAMDYFYDNRREHFRDVRAEQKQNYELKKEIIAELEQLTDHEDPEKAVSLAKELQEKYRKIGFVPIKKKNKIAADYKKVCDRIYQRARSESDTGSTESAGKVERKNDKAIHTEFIRLKKECDKLNNEILRLQDTKTFINPGGQGGELIDDIQQKIDHAQKSLQEKQDKMENLRRKMD